MRWNAARGGGPRAKRLLPSWAALILPLLLGLSPQSKATKVPLETAHGNCRLCHLSHPKGAPMNAPAKRSIAVAPALDAVCLGCHQGPPSPQTDLGATKLPAWSGAGSSHIDGPAMERARAYARGVDRGGRRPVQLKLQCSACHDVHAKDRASVLSPMGFDPLGKPTRARPTQVAQVCYGCHAGPEAARLSRSEADLGGLMRATGGGSAHRPGVTAASRTDLPSLRGGLFTGTLDCTSCHDNSNPGGARGPHASAYPRLLKASYGREGDVASTGSRSDELCYLCHDRHSIQSNQSFPLHAQHIMGFTAALPVKRAGAPQMPSWLAGPGRPAPRTTLGAPAPRAGFGQPTPCATCHDPHGSSKQPALVSFDKNVVTRASVGVVEFQRLGFGRGTCTLACHGYDHVQVSY